MGSGCGAAALTTGGRQLSGACCRCPAHQQPLCEQYRLAQRGAAHCYARGLVGHPTAVAVAAASSRALQAWLAPPEPLLEPPAKRPCVMLALVVAGRCPRPDCCTPNLPARRGRVQRTLPRVGSNLSPPPPPDPAGTQVGGGGDTGGEPQWIGIDGTRRAAKPSPPSPGASALGDGATPHGGGGRRTPPHVPCFFRDFTCADRVMGTTTTCLPPPPLPFGRRGGQGDR